MIGLGYTERTPAVIRRTCWKPGLVHGLHPVPAGDLARALEALLTFQTLVEDLTALPVAGASLLDEATAAAEAMTLARRAARRGRIFLADGDCLPQTWPCWPPGPSRSASSSRAGHPRTVAAQPEGELFGVLLQYPGASGEIRDLRPAIEAAHARGALAAVAADLLALTLLMPPGELGADIAVGSTQRFGVPMGYGGPHAPTSPRDDLRRRLPGRLWASPSTPTAAAYRLALQAREQHIRREKATSNICTAQVLLAVMAAMYAVYHGPGGLAAIAASVHGAPPGWPPRCGPAACVADGPVLTPSGCACGPARPRLRWSGPARPATTCPGRRRHRSGGLRRDHHGRGLLEVAALRPPGRTGPRSRPGSPGRPVLPAA